VTDAKRPPPRAAACYQRLIWPAASANLCNMLGGFTWVDIQILVPFFGIPLVLFWFYKYFKAKRVLKQRRAEGTNMGWSEDESAVAQATWPTAVLLGAIVLWIFLVYACEFRTGRDPYPLYCQDSPCD